MFYKIDFSSGRITRFALVALLAAAALPAFAGDNSEVVRWVSTQDLNLASPSGQQILKHRLAVAANKVCEQILGSRQLTTNAMPSCYTDALADARVQANAMIAAAEKPSATRLAANQP